MARTNDIFVFLRLVNQRRFAAGMKASAASVAAFHAEITAANTGVGRLAATGRIAESALGALGAATSVLSRGLALATGAVAFYGIQFNATMEANQLAFGRFVGAGKAAAEFTRTLFQIARDTPFSFQDITQVGRRLLAFGFDANETTKLLRIMGDTISVTGGSTPELLRLGKALGDIRAKGRLMQQELNQLANVGIPIVPLLTKQLGLTQKQLGNIGRAGIDSATAISAIETVLQQQFGGGGKQYLKTFNGQLQKLRDNLQQASGQATSGLFGTLKDGLTWLNKEMPKVDKFLASKGFKDAANSVLGAIGKGFVFVKDRVKEFLDAIKPAAPFFSNVLGPVLKGFAVGILGGIIVGWKIFIGAIKVGATILGWLGKRLGFLKPLFYAIGYVLSFFVGPGLLKVAEWMSKLGGVFKLAGGLLQIFMIPFRFFGAILDRIAPLIAKIIPGFGAFGKAIRTKLVDGFKSALLFIAQLPKVGPILFKAGLKLGDFLFKGMKERIVKIFTGTFALAMSLGDSLRKWLNKHTIFGNTIDIGVAHVHIPALASGGVISGMGLVGEEGPEIAQHTSRGTVITPLSRNRMNAPSSSGAAIRSSALRSPRIPYHVTVMVPDGRVLGEVAGEFYSDEKAKR